MKRLPVFLLAFLAVFVNLDAQKAIDKFIDRNLNQKKAYAVSLPGWFVRATAKAVRNFDEENESKYWELTDYIKNFRFLLIEGHNPIDQMELTETLSDLTEKEGFDQYIAVRDKSTKVNVYAREHKNKITSLVFLVNTNDVFVVMRLKTKIPLQLFEDLNYQLVLNQNPNRDISEINQ